MKSVIFDFDGVIANTEHVFAHFDCMLLNKVLQKAKQKPDLTPEYIRTLAGNSDIQKLQIIEEKIGADLSKYKDEYTTDRTKRRPTLFNKNPAPLAKNLDKLLTQLNGNYAIATNKIEAKISPDLKALKLDKKFPSIITTDNLPKKPDPDILIESAKQLGTTPENCIYIGDNPIDMQAATNASMTAIGFIIEGIENAPHRVLDLTKSGAQYICDDMADIIEYL